MIRAEFHLHTAFSPDSRMSLPTAVRACQKRGINCVFVTDHNAIAGALAMQKIAPFTVIPSEEITTAEGEIIGYFLTERIPPGLSPEETIRRIRAQGGLVSVPHPFDRLRHACLSRAALDRIIQDVALLEVFNARNVFSEDDRRAEEYCREHRKIPIAASDAHSRWEVGQSFVELPDFLNAQELLAALRRAVLHRHRSFLGVHAITKWNKATKKKLIS